MVRIFYRKHPLHLANRQVHRKRRPILAAGRDFAADADDLLFARRQVMVNGPIVALAIGTRHQQPDVALEHLLGGIPEQAFGLKVL
jgi:hypothetical protein